jgi:hypothetical protein
MRPTAIGILFAGVLVTSVVSAIGSHSIPAALLATVASLQYPG